MTIVGCAAPCGPSTAPFVSARCVVVLLSFPAIYTAQTSCPRVSSVCASVLCFVTLKSYLGVSKATNLAQSK